MKIFLLNDDIIISLGEKRCLASFFVFLKKVIYVGNIDITIHIFNNVATQKYLTKQCRSIKGAGPDRK